jgi:hypothetical protein
LSKALRCFSTFGMPSATSLEWQKGTKIEATKPTQTRPKQEKK